MGPEDFSLLAKILTGDQLCATCQRYITPDSDWEVVVTVRDTFELNHSECLPQSLDKWRISYPWGPGQNPVNPENSN